MRQLNSLLESSLVEIKSCNPVRRHAVKQVITRCQKLWVWQRMRVRAWEKSCRLSARRPLEKERRQKPSACVTGSEVKSSPNSSAFTEKNILRRAHTLPCHGLPWHDLLATPSPLPCIS